MNRYVPAQLFSRLLELLRITHLSTTEKDIGILNLRRQTIQVSICATGTVSGERQGAPVTYNTVWGLLTSSLSLPKTIFSDARGGYHPHPF